MKLRAFLLIILVAVSIAAVAIAEKEPDCGDYHCVTPNKKGVLEEDGQIYDKSAGVTVVHGCSGLSPPCAYNSKTKVLMLPVDAAVKPIDPEVKVDMLGVQYQGFSECGSNGCNCPRDSGGCAYYMNGVKTEVPAGVENFKVIPKEAFSDQSNSQFLIVTRSPPPAIAHSGAYITPPPQQEAAQPPAVPEVPVQQPAAQPVQPETQPEPRRISIPEDTANVQSVVSGYVDNPTSIAGAEYSPEGDGYFEQVIYNDQDNNQKHELRIDQGAANVPEGSSVIVDVGQDTEATASFGNGAFTLEDGSGESTAAGDVLLSGGSTIVKGMTGPGSEEEGSVRVTANDDFTYTAEDIDGENTFHIDAGHKSLTIRAKAPGQVQESGAEPAETEPVINAVVESDGSTPAVESISVQTAPGNDVVVEFQQPDEQTQGYVEFTGDGIVITGDVPPGIDLVWKGLIDDSELSHELASVNDDIFSCIRSGASSEEAAAPAATSFFSFAGKAWSWITGRAGSDRKSSIGDMIKGESHTEGQGFSSTPEKINVEMFGVRINYEYADSAGLNYTAVDSDGDGNIDFYLEGRPKREDIFDIARKPNESSMPISGYFTPNTGSVLGDGALGRRKDMCMERCSSSVCINEVCKSHFSVTIGPDDNPEEMLAESRKDYENCLRGVPGYCPASTDCYSDCVRYS